LVFLLSLLIFAFYRRYGSRLLVSFCSEYIYIYIEICYKSIDIFIETAIKSTECKTKNAKKHCIDVVRQMIILETVSKNIVPYFIIHLSVLLTIFNFLYFKKHNIVLKVHIIQ